MNSIISTMGEIFHWVLQTTWEAGVLAVLIFAAQWLLRKRLSPTWRYGLWLLLVVRLMMPVTPRSAVSIFNLARATPDGSSRESVVQAAPANHERRPAKADYPSQNSLTQPSISESRYLATPVPISQPANRVVAVKAMRTVDWFAVAMGCWLVGVIYFGVRLVWTNYRFRSRIGSCPNIVDEGVMELFEECRSALKLTETVRLIESEEVESPAVYGFRQKWLLLPDGVFERFSMEELRCIFLHELAHIKRGDLAVNWLVAVLKAVHWFNPLLWIAWRRMRADRELATDALAMAHVRENRRTPYGEAILKVVEDFAGRRVMSGLVGIGEDKAQLAERLAAIRHPRRYTKWLALGIAVLIAAVGLTRAQNKEASAANYRPDMTGHVESADGRPIPATIFISTAAPKVGTSPYCPSCYPDCRKSAKTDAAGKFKIESLDPQLSFRILVVAEGYQPKFVSKVYPPKGAVEVKLEKEDLASVPVKQIIRGRVVDTKGNPVEGAAIEVRGIETDNGGKSWGTIQGFDPLAVSDAHGRFVLAGHREFANVDLQATAAGFAPKRFGKLAGGQENELVLTEGATITGRVMFHGKPLPNVSVGVVSADRDMERYAGNYDVGTDAEGRFKFLNLPPGVNYNLYGMMGTLQKYGAIPVSAIVAGADGSVKDAGDLNVVPGHRVAGQVKLDDGGSVPPQTRLMLGRKDAWDSMLIELDSQGHFDVAEVPDGGVSLGVQVQGYHASIKNASLDQLNPFGLVGLVNHDITNLVVLMEKGPALKPHFDGMADAANLPENKPLEGAERAGDNSRARKFVGRLTDANTGAGIAKFKITPREFNRQGLALSWNPNLAVQGHDGNYEINVPKGARLIELKFEADGYLPAATGPMSERDEHHDFTLEQGSGPAGTVLAPDGKPAADAVVLMTAPDDGRLALCLGTGGKFTQVNEKKLLTKTDANGHFSFAPRLEAGAIAVSSSEGFKMVPIKSLTTNSIMKLEAWGKIRGVLRRESKPSAGEPIELNFAGANDGLGLWLDLRTKTDASGTFDFDHVPSGACEITTSLVMGQDAADRERLKLVHVPAGTVADVTVDAGAKRPPKMISQRVAPAQSTLQGIVLLPDGKPAVNAQVGFRNSQPDLSIDAGELVPTGPTASVGRTGADGTFSVPKRNTAKALYVVSEAGFAKLSAASCTNGVKVVLEPWARIEGVLLTNRQPAANQSIQLSGVEQEFVLPTFQSPGITDAAGRFTFTHVPPGQCRFYRKIPIKGGWAGADPFFVTVAAGQNTNVVWGKDGRPVTGKCIIENKADLSEDAVIKVLIKTPYNPSSGVTIIRNGQRNDRYFNAPLQPDGSFEVDNVPPGTYDLMFTTISGPPEEGEIKELYSKPKSVTIPDLSNPDKCEPFDLGEIKATLAEAPAALKARASRNQLKTGDTAPAFKTKTLSGHELSLSDYTGKYVLLDLRYMLPATESEQIEAVNKSFGKDDRLVIISLCKTADEDYLKKLPSQGAHWVQGDLDYEGMQDSYALNSTPFPAIMLIDPKGKIVATGLSGEQISSTVATALAK